MFWVALASLIMMLSGEGDDVSVVVHFITAIERAIASEVHDPDHRAKSTAALLEYQRLFAEHRSKLHELAKCIEEADRNFRATAETYEACRAPFDVHWSSLAERLDETRGELQASLTEDEVARVSAALEKDEDSAPVLARARNPRPSPPPVPQRRRGVEGVAAQRHLTVPRNTLAILLGPGQIQTFAHRFAAGSIEAGTNYTRNEYAAPLQEQWMMRGGVVFGLFDDFEAGALFLPIELSPDPHFDDVTVFLNRQLRLGALDVVARFAFRTPAEAGWGLNPGLIGRYRLHPRLALDTGLQVPVELGSRKHPRSPLIGLNVPLRATWNLTPQLYLLGTTGFAVDDLSTSNSAAVPLGVGLGYGILWGKRLVDLNGTFDWLGLVHPAPGSGRDALDAGSYRVSFGVSLHWQVL